MAAQEKSPQSLVSSTDSKSTGKTSPELSEGAEDDVWGDDAHDTHAQDEALSDLPTLKRQHMTDGYREGLSIGKAKVMQQGFDEGYPLGIQIGLRAGKILGVLEGYLASTSAHLSPSLLSQIQETLNWAKKELAIPRLLSSVDEESLMRSRTLPPSVSHSLQKWEELLFGPIKEPTTNHP